jgi:hypothetical protein
MAKCHRRKWSAAVGRGVAFGRLPLTGRLLEGHDGFNEALKELL